LLRRRLSHRRPPEIHSDGGKHKSQTIHVVRLSFCVSSSDGFDGWRVLFKDQGGETIVGPVKIAQAVPLPLSAQKVRSSQGPADVKLIVTVHVAPSSLASTR
jgi:hypothetical protein